MKWTRSGPTPHEKGCPHGVVLADVKKSPSSRQFEYGTPIAPEPSPEAFRRETAVRILLALIAAGATNAGLAVSLADSLFAHLDRLEER